jgi:hypothetical protein
LPIDAAGARVVYHRTRVLTCGGGSRRAGAGTGWKDGLVTSPPENEGTDLASMRLDYGAAGLDERSLARDWETQSARWLAEAVVTGEPEPNSMVLASADLDARPSARTVLLKAYDGQGLVFYTNCESRKGTELAVVVEVGGWPAQPPRGLRGWMGRMGD